MEYLDQAHALLTRLAGQAGALDKAAELMAEAIAKGRLVHVFGSGHSVIPALDIFPRYGSFVGFHPLLDPRLMWTNVLGPGGAPELLWLERQEGYIEHFLDAEPITSGDVLLAFSHGGLNAAPVEAAQYCQSRGVKVVAVTSMDNAKTHPATHSSGKRLCDLGDVVIDNCVPSEDALVPVAGLREPLAAGSTVAVVTVVGMLVSEVGKKLVARNIRPDVFVSPNVEGVGPHHNEGVFAAYGAYVGKARASAVREA